MKCKKASSAVTLLMMVGCGSNVGTGIQVNQQQADDPYRLIDDSLRSFCVDWGDGDIAEGIVDIWSIQDDGWTLDGARQLAESTCRTQCTGCEVACRTCNEAMIFRVYDEQFQQTIEHATAGAAIGVANLYAP